MRRFTVSALADGRSAEVWFYQEIDPSGEFGISQTQFIEALNTIGPVQKVIVRMNCLGGDVFHGIGIYRALKRFNAEIEIRVEGVAASAGSVVAMAGDTVIMEPGSMMMIHKPFMPFIIGADEDELLRRHDALTTVKESIVSIYARKSGRSTDEIVEMVNKTHWMTAEEAVENGFADMVGEEEISVDNYEMQMRAEDAFDCLYRSVQNAAPTLEIRNAITAESVFAFPKEFGRNGRQKSAGAPLTDKSAQRRDDNPIAQGEGSAMSKLERLRAEFAALQTKLNNIQDKAQAEDGRDFTQTELDQIKEMRAQQQGIDNQIKALTEIGAGEDYLNQSAGTVVNNSAGAGKDSQPKGERGTPSNPGQGPTIISPREPVAPHVRGDFGYQTHALGRHAVDVYNYTKSGTVSNNLQRIMAASGDLVSGTSGADGGFAVAPDVRQEIYTTAIEQDPLLSRCWTPPTGSRSVQIPVDDTQVWEEDRGVQAYPVKEGGAATESKPELTFADIKLNKITALVKVSEEMLEDAPFLDAYLRKKATEQLNWKASKQVLFGSGAGEALGIFASDAVATAAALDSQTADTIFAENVWDMEASMPANYFNNAVWLHSGTSIRHLRGLKIQATGEVIGLDNLRNGGESALSGRPLLRHELMKAVGDLNDFALIDFSQYAAPIKSGGVQEARSMHFEFDKSREAFRFTMRFGGQPLINKPALSPDGVTQLSPFVNLAAR